MANAGPGRRQPILYNLCPTPHLDGAHSIFGAVDSAEDQKVVDSIEQGDSIMSITVAGDTAELLHAHADRIAAWDEATTD